MTRLPAVNATTLVRALHKLGFDTTRTKGSHHILKHPDGRWTVVPWHGGVDISRPLLRKILRQADVSTQDFLQAVS